MNEAKGDTRCWYADNTYAQFQKWICGANAHKLWWRRWLVVGVVVEHFFGVTWNNVYENDSHDATVISHTFLSYLIYTTTAKKCTRGDVSAAVPDLRWCLFVYYRRADCWTISLATDDDDDDILNRKVRKTSRTCLHHLVRGIDIDFQSLGISRTFHRTSQLLSNECVIRYIIVLARQTGPKEERIFSSFSSLLDFTVYTSLDSSFVYTHRYFSSSSETSGGEVLSMFNLKRRRNALNIWCV